MSARTLNALIFDVDGTLADTEAVHLEAFNEAFAAEGLDWRWTPEEYTQLLEVSGGKERMLHYWKQREPHRVEVDTAARSEVVARIHEHKTALYAQRLRDGAVRLRPGVSELIEAASAGGLKLAIATTTSPVNIGALLAPALGADWRRRFVAIGDASNAPLKKPHPQVYLTVLKLMGQPAAACMAFEDSGNGLRAARAARLATVITPTGFTRHHDFGGALRVLPDLQGVAVEHLQEWLAPHAVAASA